MCLAEVIRSFYNEILENVESFVKLSEIYVRNFS